MIKGYIFDYGGTLDSKGNHWGKVIWHAYERQNVNVTEAQYRDAYVYAERYLARNPVIQPDYTFRQTLSTKLDIQLQWLVENGYLYADDATMHHLHTALLNDLYEQVVETVGHSREVLQQIQRREIPMVLVSNFYGNINAVLREFGLDGMFLTVVESAVVGVRKPDPRIFALGVEALGLPASDIMVVGDSLDKDIIPAKSLGCQTAWFKGEPWDDTKIMNETQADVIITDLLLLE